jgi:catechol 2,3-dioxygenase-like lactoylglutathione lyase family enzyme
MSNDSFINGGNATIFITDMNRAFDFYTKVLGAEPLYRAGDHFAMLDVGGGFLIGLHPPAENAGAPGSNGSTQVGLNVTESIEQVVKTLLGRGVSFVDQPGTTSLIRDDGAVKLAFFRDPDGNVLYLCQQMM